MPKGIIKDADAAVTAIDAFANLCLSIAEGNVAQAVVDTIGLAASVRNAVT